MNGRASSIEHGEVRETMEQDRAQGTGAAGAGPDDEIVTAARKSPRSMLAAIALAVDLPVPRSVNFYDDTVVMDFRTVSDGLAWAARIGAHARPYINTDGNRYLGAPIGDWHGWSVSLNGHESPEKASLSDVETAALTALAEGVES